MNEIPVMILSLSIGTLFGLFYFGGLWLTLQHLSQSKQPSIIAVVSFAVRSVVCLFGFYLISGSGLEMLAVSLVGFLLSKFVLIRRLGLTAYAGAK
jgi:F1F0 ATPase subunit 2